MVASKEMKGQKKGRAQKHRRKILKNLTRKRKPIVSSGGKKEAVGKLVSGKVKQVKVVDVKKAAQKEIKAEGKNKDRGSGVESFSLVVEPHELAREANTWEAQQKRKLLKEEEKKVPKKVILIEKKLNPSLVEKYKELLEQQSGGKPSGSTHLQPRLSLRTEVVKQQFPNLYPYIYN